VSPGLLAINIIEPPGLAHAHVARFDARRALSRRKEAVTGAWGLLVTALIAVSVRKDKNRTG
jgi:hypothetical protein